MTKTKNTVDRRRALSANELAEAAILADLALVVVIVTRLTPLSAFTQVLGCIPFAVLAMRHRFRVVSVSFWIAFILTFLLAGYGEALNVIIMVVWGSIAGRAVRNGWGWGKSLLLSLTLGWVTTATITVGFFLVLSRFRELFLEAAATQWGGLSNILGLVLPASWIDVMDRGVAWGLDRWWICVPAIEFLFGIWMTYVVRRLGGPVAERVEKAFGPPDVGGASNITTDVQHADEPRPVPVSLRDTTVAVAEKDLFHVSDLTIEPGEFVVLTGPNGAGKSTLFRMLADLQPGIELQRDGRAGLGECGGTAFIGQRPESHVLGARVIDDLRWGLQQGCSEISESEALEACGLAGFELRETATLSGGELQRLVIAGALLRRPKLVLSDESTSMLSPSGRETVLGLLRELADRGSAVVHITHIESEQSLADKVLKIEDAELVAQ